MPRQNLGRGIPYLGIVPLTSWVPRDYFPSKNKPETSLKAEAAQSFGGLALFLWQVSAVNGSVFPGNWHS
jgi:hypothetical protein